MTNRRMFWQIVERIEAAINTGVYPAGSRLPPERELADSFDVSRPTIREAIIALEVRGMVEVKTGSGVYVLEKSYEHTLKNQVNAFDVTQARALVEGEVAAIAAKNITDEELATLEQTLKDMKDGHYVEAADRTFHKIIVQATRNQAMILMVENLWNLRAATPEVIDDYSRVCSKDNEKTIAEHKAIFTALKTRDASTARQAMHQHFSRLINALFDAAEAKALEEIKRKNTAARDQYAITPLGQRML